MSKDNKEFNAFERRKYNEELQNCIAQENLNNENYKAVVKNILTIFECLPLTLYFQKDNQFIFVVTKIQFHSEAKMLRGAISMYGYVNVCGEWIKDANNGDLTQFNLSKAANLLCLNHSRHYKKLLPHQMNGVGQSNAYNDFYVLVRENSIFRNVNLTVFQQQQAMVDNNNNNIKIKSNTTKRLIINSTEISTSLIATQCQYYDNNMQTVNGTDDMYLFQPLNYILNTRYRNGSDVLNKKYSNEEFSKQFVRWHSSDIINKVIVSFKSELLKDMCSLGKECVFDKFSQNTAKILIGDYMNVLNRIDNNNNNNNNINNKSNENDTNNDDNNKSKSLMLLGDLVFIYQQYEIFHPKVPRLDDVNIQTNCAVCKTAVIEYNLFEYKKMMKTLLEPHYNKFNDMTASSFTEYSQQKKEHEQYYYICPRLKDINLTTSYTNTHSNLYVCCVKCLLKKVIESFSNGVLNMVYCPCGCNYILSIQFIIEIFKNFSTQRDNVLLMFYRIVRKSFAFQHMYLSSDIQIQCPKTNCFKLLHAKYDSNDDDGNDYIKNYNGNNSCFLTCESCDTKVCKKCLNEIKVERIENVFNICENKGNKNSLQGDKLLLYCDDEINVNNCMDDIFNYDRVKCCKDDENFFFLPRINTTIKDIIMQGNCNEYLLELYLACRLVGLQASHCPVCNVSVNYNPHLSKRFENDDFIIHCHFCQHLHCFGCKTVIPYSQSHHEKLQEMRPDVKKQIDIEKCTMSVNYSPVDFWLPINHFINKQCPCFTFTDKTMNKPSLVIAKEYYCKVFAADVLLPVLKLYGFENVTKALKNACINHKCFYLEQQEIASTIVECILEQAQIYQQ